MDLRMLQLPGSSPIVGCSQGPNVQSSQEGYVVQSSREGYVVPPSQEELPTLKGYKEGLISSDIGFGDSGIGKSMSSQVRGSMRQSTTPNIPSSPVSEDQGFINQSPIPGRFQVSEDEPMQAMFEKQQRERQWLVSKVTRQRREEGQEIAEFEEALRK
jgi:hypothetical protein